MSRKTPPVKPLGPNVVSKYFKSLINSVRIVPENLLFSLHRAKNSTKSRIHNNDVEQFFNIINRAQPSSLEPYRAYLESLGLWDYAMMNEVTQRQQAVDTAKNTQTNKDQTRIARLRALAESNEPVKLSMVDNALYNWAIRLGASNPLHDEAKHLVQLIAERKKALQELHKFTEQNSQFERASMRLKEAKNILMLRRLQLSMARALSRSALDYMNQGTPVLQDPTLEHMPHALHVFRISSPDDHEFIQAKLGPRLEVFARFARLEPTSEDPELQD